MVIVIVGEDHQIDVAQAQGLKVIRSGISRIVAAAVNQRSLSPGIEGHAEPLTHIQHRHSKPPAGEGGGLEDQSSAEGGRAEAHRHRHPASGAPPKHPQENKSIGQSHPQNQIDGMDGHRGKGQARQGSSEPLEIPHRQGDHPGHHRGHGRQHKPHQRRHQPTQEGIGHRPQGEQIGKR